MKRLLSFLVLLVLVCQISPLNAYTELSGPGGKIITLLGEKEGGIIIKKLNNFLEKSVSNDMGLLYTTLEKIGEKNIALSKSEALSKKEETLKSLYDYILVEGQKKRIDKEKRDFSMQNIGTGITETEKTKIKEKIVSLQLNLVKGALSGNETNVYSGAEMKGNFEGNIAIDQGSFGKILGKLEFKDILSKIKGIDTDISGTLGIATTIGESSGSINTQLHIIEKDGEKYIKIDNFTQSGSFGEFLPLSGENTNSFADIGKFIKLPSNSIRSEYETIAKNIQTFLPSYLEVIKKEPLFIPYKKGGNSFILIPSQKLCTLIKQVNGVGVKECDENEYASIVESYITSGIVIQLTFGDGKETFSIYRNDEQTQIYGKFITKGNTLESIIFDIIPDQTIYPKEGFSVKFTGTSLDIRARVSGFMFGTHISGTTKKYTGEFAFSFVGKGAVKGTISGSSADEKNGNLKINFTGTQILSDDDSLSGEVLVDVKNGTDVIFKIDGKYLVKEKETFFGNILYDIKVLPKDVTIEAPSNWISIEDLQNQKSPDEELP